MYTPFTTGHLRYIRRPISLHCKIQTFIDITHLLASIAKLQSYYLYNTTVNLKNTGAYILFLRVKFFPINGEKWIGMCKWGTCTYVEITKFQSRFVKWIFIPILLDKRKMCVDVNITIITKLRYLHYRVL